MPGSNFFMNSDQAVILVKSKSRQEGNWRSDSGYKFIFALDGTMYYQTKRHHLVLRKHQFLLFNPGEEHKQALLEGGKLLIEFNPVFMREIANSLHLSQSLLHFASVSQKNPGVSHWIHLLMDFLPYADPADLHSVKWFLNHSLPQLAFLLIKNAIGSHSQDFPVASVRKLRSPMEKVISAMKEQYSHEWTLEEMAAIAGMNKYPFARAFKEFAGMAPYYWLQVYRLIRSQEMLKTTDKPILSIAMECGFSSISVYNQLFKRLYGMTPRRFREMARK